MPEDKNDDTIIIEILTLVEPKPATNPNEEPAGHDPYENVPDAESTQ